MTKAEPDQTRALGEVCAKGLRWVEQKHAELEALPTSTVVVIDIKSGEYVTAKTWLEAHPLFEQRFGVGTPGFVHRVRDRTFIGGGIG
jgi:hypothetical protein